jgi:hypothetical protein
MMDEDRLIKVGIAVLANIPLNSRTRVPIMLELSFRSGIHHSLRSPSSVHHGFRIAHRLRDMQKLPFIVRRNPSLEQVVTVAQFPGSHSGGGCESLRRLSCIVCHKIL